MLSITDLMDFIDLDRETVQVVIGATGHAEVEATTLARQLLATEQGIHILHHMYRDRIAEAAARFDLSREKELRRAYTYFSRKYPMPTML